MESGLRYFKGSMSVTATPFNYSSIIINWHQLGAQFDSEAYFLISCNDRQVNDIPKLNQIIKISSPVDADRRQKQNAV